MTVDTPVSSVDEPSKTSPILVLEITETCKLHCNHSACRKFLLQFVYSDTIILSQGEGGDLSSWKISFSCFF